MPLRCEWLLVASQVIDTHTDPNCYWTTDSDIVFGSSLSQDVTIAMIDRQKRSPRPK